MWNQLASVRSGLPKLSVDSIRKPISRLHVLMQHLTPALSLAEVERLIDYADSIRNRRGPPSAHPEVCNVYGQLNRSFISHVARTLGIGCVEDSKISLQLDMALCALFDTKPFSGWDRNFKHDPGNVAMFAVRLRLMTYFTSMDEVDSGDYLPLLYADGLFVPGFVRFCGNKPTSWSRSNFVYYCKKHFKNQIKDKPLPIAD
ncbi:MAG: hypothetical protein AAF662_15330 [Pseudomonadota bacterium]